MSDSENVTMTPYETFKADVDNLCSQVEVLLNENMRDVGKNQQLPVEEFTLNPHRLATLRDKLTQAEAEVVRGVERTRLEKLLQCHHLKEAAWDNMLVKARAVYCISSDICVRNYPIIVPQQDQWRHVIDTVNQRLKDVRESVNEECGRERKSGISARGPKTSSSSTSRVSVLHDSASTRTAHQGQEEEYNNDDDDDDDEDEDGDDEDEEGSNVMSGPVLTEEDYKLLLYPQLKLDSREKVEKQLILIEFMTRRLKEAFNARFDSVHQRKEWVIDEVKRLTRKRIQLKNELTKMKEEEKAEEEENGEEGDWRKSEEEEEEEEKKEEIEKEEEEYEPKWQPEERPELLLVVEDSEITIDNSDTDNSIYEQESTHRETDRTDKSERTGGLGEDKVDRAESKISDASQFLTGARPLSALSDGASSNIRGMTQTQRGRGERTWAEARALREWRAAREEEGRKRRAHTATLKLQLERITPTITSLIQDFDNQVWNVAGYRVETDEALLLYRLVSARLNARLTKHTQLKATLNELMQQREEVEIKVKEAEEEEERTRLEEMRAKGKQERLGEQLKEEEAGLKRALINLPMDQYNHLLALYSKKYATGLRHLDLPSARGGGDGGAVPSTPHSPSTNRGPSPATPEGCIPRGRRGSGRPSPPTSTPTHSDDPRHDHHSEDIMPAGLCGGARTWRQFQRYRRKRHDILDEVHQAVAKRSAAAAHFSAITTRRHTLNHQADQLDSTINSTKHELEQLDEDAEVVAIVAGGKVKLDIRSATENLNPDFTNTCLVNDEELRRLETTARRCTESEGGIEEEDDKEEEEVRGGEEVEALRNLRDQLKLEVEVAKQDLHQINNFKVGRNVMAAAEGVAKGEGAGQDPSHLYASLQRLQQLQGKRAEKVAASCEKVEKQVRVGRRRVRELQGTADQLAREIEELQKQVAHARPDAAMTSREARLRRVMKCSDLTEQCKKKQGTILDLQTELDNLRLRTFPTLTRHSQQ